MSIRIIEHAGDGTTVEQAATNRLVRPEVDRYRINIVDRDPTRLYGLGLAP